MERTTVVPVVLLLALTLQRRSVPVEHRDFLTSFGAMGEAGQDTSAFATCP